MSVFIQFAFTLLLLFSPHPATLAETVPITHGPILGRPGARSTASPSARRRPADRIITGRQIDQQRDRVHLRQRQVVAWREAQHSAPAVHGRRPQPRLVGGQGGGAIRQQGGEIVVVLAFYEWPIHANILGLGLATLSNGKHLIAATTAFRNEPF